MTVTSFFLIFFGILTTTWCLAKPEDLAGIGNSMIIHNSRDDFISSNSLLEALVDSKCKQYSADLQDQIDQLRAKVDQIENDPSPSGRSKRNAKKPPPAPACPTSSSFCTYYYPDRLNANLKKGNFSPATVQLRARVDQNEINHPPTKSKREAKKPSPSPSCSTSKSFCTYYYPDHPDASLKNENLTKTVTNNVMLLQNDPRNQFRGMPTSCKDLQKRGHSFNGFYSIKKVQPNNQGTKLETIYCDFILPTDSKGFETRIGVVDVKSSAVYFYVERTEEGYGEDGQKITFLKEVFNVGGGFDWNNQLFRAPYSGIYFFSITGSKYNGFLSTRANIVVKLNNEVIGQALSSGNTQWGGFSYQFSKRLNSNDTVELVMQWGKTYLLYFTGFMLEEDLTI